MIFKVFDLAVTGLFPYFNRLMYVHMCLGIVGKGYQLQDKGTNEVSTNFEFVQKGLSNLFVTRHELKKKILFLSQNGNYEGQKVFELKAVCTYFLMI